MDEIVFELINLNKSHLDHNLKKYIGRPNSKVVRLFKRYEKKKYQPISGDDKAALMLRVSLIKKLNALVPKIDLHKIKRTKHFSDFFSTLKDLYTARLLLSIGLYSSGSWLMQKTIAKAEKMEIWDAVLSGATILTSYFAIRQDRRNYILYCKKADAAIEIITKEQKLKRLVNKWILFFSQRRKATERAIDVLKKDIEEIEKEVYDADHVNIIHLLNRLKLIYFDSKMDYGNTLKVCEDARKKILNKTGYSDYNKFGIYHGVQMYCYLNLREFEKAKLFAEELEQFIPKGTLNWFIFMEYYFVLTVQAKDYDKSYKIFDSISQSIGFEKLKGVRADVWKLLVGYMQFLVISKIWTDAPDFVTKRSFKVKRFMNDVFNLSSDKTGLQVSVLILQTLFLLEQKNYEEIIERKDAMRRYISRHLHSKDNERSRFFLTMLLRMVECQFSYDVTKEKTKRLLKQLKSQEMNYQANLGGNEIVDYELLWSWVLNTLKKNWSTAVA